MRKASHLLCVVLSVLSTGVFVSPAAASGYADPEEPPTETFLIDATAGGSGCLSGVESVTMAPDNSSLMVSYPNYQARVGVGAVSTDSRKSCQVAVTVHAPEDVTFMVSAVDTTEYASVAQGASVQDWGNTYFQGQPQTAPLTHTISGPFDSEWVHTKTIPVASIVWAPCGAPRTLALNTELRALLGTSDYKTTTSSISMESAVYHLVWAPCPSPSAA
jgi:hypothetical protein